jgi:hypothetical protein
MCGCLDSRTICLRRAVQVVLPLMLDERSGRVPFLALGCHLLGFDEGCDGLSVESGASTEYMKV